MKPKCHNIGPQSDDLWTFYSENCLDCWETECIWRCMYEEEELGIPSTTAGVS